MSSTNTHRILSKALLGFALFGAMSAAPGLASAQTEVSCSSVLSLVVNDSRGTGTVVGKSNQNYSMVKVMTDPAFNPNTWNPASSGASGFNISSNASHLRGEFQAVQTFSSTLGNPGFSEQHDLWIYRNGQVYSRSLTWGSGWSQWRNVRCYQAPGRGTHYGTSDPLQRIIIQGWEPSSASFMTVDLVEYEDITLL